MTHVVDHVEATRLFWRHHLRIGFFILIGESAATAGYAMISAGDHRPLLIATSLTSVVAGVVMLFTIVDAVAHQPWRETFSFAWTLSSGALLALIAYLDGGFGSPLLVLVPLPVVFAALAFSRDRVASCGVLALIEFLIVSILGDDQLTQGEMLIWAAGGIGLTCLAVAAATNRIRLEERGQALDRQLAELATTDGLTGCLNHRAFTKRFDEEIARATRHGWPLTVLVADIDHFKSINDTHGHPAGDDVLVVVAAAMRTDLRKGDFVGRMGGDEFVIALPNTGLDGGTARAERIRQMLLRSTSVPATVSIGISALDHHAPSARTVIEAADKALYQVKHTGRTGVATIDAGHCGHVVSR